MPTTVFLVAGEDSGDAHAAELATALRGRDPEFARLMRDTVETIAKLQPALVVGVDYPGFNLRLAARVKKRGLRWCQYVSPQVWAWRRGRIGKIKQVVDRMITILPF